MRSSLLIATVLAAMTTPAWAALPPSVSAMLDDAIANGNEAEVDAIAKFARKAHPEESEHIDAQLASYKAKIAADNVAKAEAAKAKLAEAGFLDNWKGQGELGGFVTSGNSDTIGMSAGLSMSREGAKWRHNARILADYQKSNGITDREQFLAALEPHYKFNQHLFAYGLGQFERDRFQGFSSRYTVSGGMGYRAIARDNMTWDLKAGPAWRKTRFLGGGSDSALTGFANTAFRWKISPTLSFGEDASAFFQSGNSTLTSLTALDAKLGGALSARLSYQIDQETAPPAGLKKTDTISRVTLVYGF